MVVQTKEVQVNGESLHKYIESSYENLAGLPDDTRLAHKRLPGASSDDDQPQRLISESERF